MLGLSLKLAVFTQVAMAVIHILILCVFSKYDVHYTMLFYIIAALICVVGITRWYEYFGRKLFSKTQIEAMLFRSHARQEEDLAKASATSYGQIVSGTAHDMRTPVAAIQSGCIVLQRQLKMKAFEKMSTTILLMEAALQTCLSFLDCMLLSSRLLEGVDIMMSKEEIDVQEMVDKAVACCKLCSSPAAPITVAHLIASNVAERIYSDPQSILRNLMNLLNNSCQHTQEGSIRLYIEVCDQHSQQIPPGATSRRSDLFLKFSVIDTGLGHFCDPSIWEPFVSGRSPGTQGTGMGLFVVKRQAEGLGGSCGSCNNPGGGSTFWFQVPYITADAAQGAAVDNAGMAVEMQAAVSPGRAENPQRPSILLIDDTRALLDLHALSLEEEGYKVTRAYGPVEGLEALKSNRFTLCLCDVQMIGMNGDELTKAFRVWEEEHERGSPQCIYALTAYANSNVREKCRQAGMHGVLVKPLPPQVVSQLIQDAITQYPI